MGINQSVCFPIFAEKDEDLTALFQEVSRIGYEAVEFWDRKLFESYESVIDTAHAVNLAVASMSGHDSLPDGLNKRENHERIESELRQSIDIAAKYNIPGIICFSGNRNHGQSDLEGMVVCAQGLKKIAPYAEEKGVNLNIELLNSKVDHPGYQCDKTDWGVALCEMVGSPRVKLLFDIYHMQIMEGDIIRSIRRNIRWIGHFHTAGNPGRNEMDDTQELNYSGICKAISQTGYELYVGHEYKPKADLTVSLRSTFALCNV